MYECSHGGVDDASGEMLEVCSICVLEWSVCCEFGEAFDG